VPPTVFSKDTVRELLQHEFYSGVVAYFGVDEKGQKRKRKNPLEVFPGEHPALISAADFARAQELRKMFAHRVRLGRTYPRMYPLSGLILCDTCGRNMRAITSGGRSYYRDVTHANHIDNCVQKTVRAEVAEQQVVDLLCAVKLPIDWPEWVIPYGAATSHRRSGRRWWKPSRRCRRGWTGRLSCTWVGRSARRSTRPRSGTPKASGGQGRIASGGAGCYYSCRTYAGGVRPTVGGCANALGKE